MQSCDLTMQHPLVGKSEYLAAYTPQITDMYSIEYLCPDTPKYCSICQHCYTIAPHIVQSTSTAPSISNKLGTLHNKLQGLHNKLQGLHNKLQILPKRLQYGHVRMYVRIIQFLTTLPNAWQMLLNSENYLKGVNYCFPGTHQHQPPLSHQHPLGGCWWLSRLALEVKQRAEGTMLPVCHAFGVFFPAPPASSLGMEENMTYCSHQTNSNLI